MIEGFELLDVAGDTKRTPVVRYGPNGDRGNLDNTTCFHCDIGLRDWVPGDIAFAEHVRWSPFCVYATSVKGKTFIDERRRMAHQNGTGGHSQCSIK